MIRKTAWTSNPFEGGTRFELEPPGFVAFYRVALFSFFLCGGLVLPLSLLAIFAALVFDDFGVGLSLAAGVVGFGSLAALIWLFVWILMGATSSRSRVTVTPGGVLVETGVTSVRKRVWLAPLDAVSVDKPKVDSLERRGVVLAAPDASIHIAAGYRERDTDRVLKAVRGALENTDAETAEPPPPGPRMGPPWGDRVRRLVRDIVAPLRHPTPYLAVDLGAIVGTSALTWFFDELIDWQDAYPFAFGLFILGMAARWYDGSYIAGLRAYVRDDHVWGIWYILGAIAIGLVGAGAMASRLTLGPAVGVAMISSIGLHWAMLRRAGSEATPKPNRKLDVVLALTLVPISILHELAMFRFIGSSKDLAVMSLGFIPMIVLLLYAPIRLHAFVDNPGDRSNVVWFWLTAIWLGSGPIIAMMIALVHEI